MTFEQAMGCMRNGQSVRWRTWEPGIRMAKAEAGEIVMFREGRALYSVSELTLIVLTRKAAGWEIAP